MNIENIDELIKKIAKSELLSTQENSRKYSLKQKIFWIKEKILQ